MWGAIKSDLFEFITTVQEEAQDTLSKVVDISAPRTDEEEEKISEDERILSEFRRNLTTYSEDVATEQLPEFEKFVKGFSLSSKAEEIEYILELESDVSKHYDILVPAQMTPDLFWARYFFKVNILIISSLDSVLESAYDEEEELSWGEEDEEDNNDNANEQRKETEKSVISTTSTSNQEPAKEGETSPNTPFVDDARTEGATHPTKQTDAHTNNVDAEEVALLAARNISQLQEANANLSTRARMLEGEVEKLQNQLIKERTVSAKLRTSVTQGEEREKMLAAQVKDLTIQLTESRAKTAEATAVAKKDTQQQIPPPNEIQIESAPISSDSSNSSIVDLGAEHESHSPPRTQSHKRQHVSGKETVATATESDKINNNPDSIRDKKDDKEELRGDDDDEEEEWDNEAWE